MKNRHFAIVVLAMVTLLILPLAANADQVWNFFGPQSPFPNAPTTPAVAVGSGAVTVTNAAGFKVTLTPYSTGPTNPAASNGIPGQLTGRNLGPGSDEQGAGVGPGPYVEADSTTFEVNGTEAIRVDFTDFANIPSAASQHLLFNSLTPAAGGPAEMAHIWQDCVGCTSLGTIVHNPATFPAPEDFTIPPTAFGHPIFVTADVADFLLYGVLVDTTPPAALGESPYIAIVDNDALTANPFYFSPKHLQFLYNQSPTGIAQAAPVCFGTLPPVNQYTRAGAAGCEQFRSQTLNNQAEVCDTTGTSVAPNFVDRGLRNAVTPAGNSGFYEWWIRVPEKPSGEINIVLECGVLKPNAFAAYKYGSIELCAAETGERIGFGTCVRQEVDPGVSPVQNIALPKVTAVAYPGPNNVAFAPFHLTAFKNPSTYTLAFDGVTFAMSNNGNSQVLDGSTNARILLKACMDKTIVTKLPVTGQINASGETENDLEAGDLIQVRMDVPRQNSVDIYCHAQSARLAGIGEGF